MIGETMTVTKAKNPQLEGTAGKVLYETRNTVVLRTGTGRKTLVKEQLEEAR